MILNVMWIRKHWNNVFWLRLKVMLRFFDLKFEMMKSLSLSPSQPHHTMYCKQIKLNEILRMRIEDDDQLGNVDVEGEMDSGDHNDSVDTQKQNEFKLFNWIPWPWSMESAYASVVTIPMCCCVTFICWICLKKRGKRNMSKELETYQISDKTCKMEVPEVKADNEDEKENGDTDGMPQTVMRPPVLMIKVKERVVMISTRIQKSSMSNT
eukprot:942104_1